ncbi:MAG: sulfatase-like hydrolase/transferase, partial [Bacteroidota bacterium]|nr:sulfatase-like hydrolase/transferase [Bacteroidota bacterium]
EGQQIIHTPNIDKLAAEGLRFTNAYSSMLCAPARASLITGMHDCHSKAFEITNAGIYKEIGSGDRTHQEVEEAINSRLSPVPEDAVFLAQVARETGYVTAQFGKLEWGFAATHSQMGRHGWDRYFGYLDHVRAHGFYPPYLFGNGELYPISGNTRSDCGKTGEPETKNTFEERWDMTGKEVYSQEIFMDSVLAFLGEHRDRPFFLYFPTQLPHGPVSIPVVHPDVTDDDRLTRIEKEYASMVIMLDDHVGRIMQELKNLQIDDKTMVIFTSDNGHEIYYEKEGRIHKPYTNMQTGELFDNLDRKYYSNLAGDVFDGNGGRAGLKRSNLQGGVKVPLLIRWPGVIRPGQVSERLVVAYDLLPTLAEITGYGGSFRSDGLSFYGELTGNGTEKEHDYIVFSSFTGPALLTSDGWKIRSYLKEDVFELYYLPDDFREEINLAEAKPVKLEELKQLLLLACDGDYRNGLYLPQKSQIAVR